MLQKVFIVLARLAFFMSKLRAFSFKKIKKNRTEEVTIFNLLRNALMLRRTI